MSSPNLDFDVSLLQECEKTLHLRNHMVNLPKVGRWVVKCGECLQKFKVFEFFILAFSFRILKFRFNIKTEQVYFNLY